MTDDTTFVALDEAAVIALVTETPGLRAVVDPVGLRAVEVGDGNLNHVFVVTSQADLTSGLVVKQALPYLRVAGEGWPLTRERMRFETQSLLLYNEFTPERAPAVYAHDTDQSWVAMEFLADHQVMRQAILGGEQVGSVGRDIGTFVAALAFHSSEMSLDAPAKRELAVKYSNPELCNLQEDFVFTNPFCDSEENSWNPELDADVQRIRADRDIKLAIARAKADYMDHAQALLHGDLHTGSVMIRTGADRDPDTRVIDPEFAFVGPIAYDLGTFLAHLAIGVLVHEELTEDPEQRTELQRPLLDDMGLTWGSFVAGIEARWTSDNSGDLAAARYWQGDSAGFEAFRADYLHAIAASLGMHGGAELLRRCMGIVSVAELEAIEDLTARARVERALIGLARQWLLTPDDGGDDTVGRLASQVAAASTLAGGSHA